MGAHEDDIAACKPRRKSKGTVDHSNQISSLTPGNVAVIFIQF